MLVEEDAGFNSGAPEFVQASLTPWAVEGIDVVTICISESSLTRGREDLSFLLQELLVLGGRRSILINYSDSFLYLFSLK